MLPLPCSRGEQLMTKMDELVKEAQQLTNMVGKPVQFTMRLQTSWDESNLSARTTGAGASFDAMQLDATVQVRDTRCVPAVNLLALVRLYDATFTVRCWYKLHMTLLKQLVLCFVF